MKLYHYVHCPFCIRVRMGLGLLSISYESVVLPYNDELTPVQLTGVKMLPILEISKGNAINESLNILKKFDATNLLAWQAYDKLFNEVETLVSKMGSPVHSLCMPYWIWTPEFNPESRKYFQIKKEAKRGPFTNLIKNKEISIKNLNDILSNELEEHLSPFYKSSTLTIIDIMIASHLWGMYIFPEFQFTLKMHQYLQSVKDLTHFDYHQDFWK
ncbi:MAG: glutaredoxin 2 [Bacteriovorax sp.]|nr:glutaredoxin 2 [Bacteriovorax sp.]